MSRESHRRSPQSSVLVLGHASIHVTRFVRGLCAAGQPVVLATDGPVDLEPSSNLLAQIRVDLNIKSLRAQWQLHQLIKQWRPSLVQVHQANRVAWHGVWAARMHGLPSVVTLWGSDILKLGDWHPVYQSMVELALRQASAWTADARVLLDAARQRCGSREGQPQEWIPIGIDPRPPGQAQVGREKRLLSCRLHSPLYRIDRILEAFAALPPTYADWVLEVAAAGQETAALTDLAHRLGLGARVEFTGMLDAAALTRAYQRSAVFVSVPESDGTSVSLLEAMSAGCLPVLSDLPANREWVTDGVNGRLVGDLTDLSAVLQAAIQWCESGRWANEGALHNRALISSKGMFPSNIQQFLSLYGRLKGGQP